MSSVPGTGPEGNRAIEPRCCFPYAAAGPAYPVSDSRSVTGVPRSNGMGLAGHQRHYYPGYRDATLYYIISFSLFPMVTLLALLPVVVMTRPVGAAITAPPLQAAQLVARCLAVQ